MKRVFRVVGRVLGNWQALKTGRPQQGYVRVNLSPTGSPCGVSAFWGAVTPDGRFEIRNAPPGNYAACLLFVNADARAIAQTASLTVVDQDITDLTFDFDRRSVTVLGQPAEPVPASP